MVKRLHHLWLTYASDLIDWSRLSNQLISGSSPATASLSNQFEKLLRMDYVGAPILLLRSSSTCQVSLSVFA
ncbi:unnamed protein product [Protopolystoma xenopodis]|uniref:Uncharacterized protein n=1 Tax=Protopolystoma xenopodis TaxID=117903 RepID=A0A3S5AZN0_9PLAT|nr:unnamed protein product [Protopolystoma xenopodis]